MAAVPNPFIIIKGFLDANIYPTPSAGFKHRLIGLMILSGYLIFITMVFMLLYVLALRRQDKPFWMWRVVSKSEGRYIVLNIFAFMTSFFVTGPLIIAYLNDTRDVYYHRGSQHHIFVWRYGVFFIAWLQGWFLSYANIQAALITRIEKTSRHLPKIVNTAYILGPIVFLIAILIPGILSSNSWDNVYAAYVDAVALSTKGTAVYKATGTVDEALFQELLHQQSMVQSHYKDFNARYLVMLAVWSIGCFALVFANLAGAVLVLRIRRQVKFVGGLDQNGVKSATPSYLVQMPFSTSNMASINEKSAFDQNEALSSSPKSPIPIAASGDKMPLSSLPTHTASHPLKRMLSIVPKYNASPENAHHQALKKLVRDLSIAITAITLLTLAFAIENIVMACFNDRLATDWPFFECAITFVVWSYLVVASIAMTGLAINEAYFVFWTGQHRDTATESTPSIIKRSPKAVLVHTESMVQVERSEEGISDASTWRR